MTLPDVAAAILRRRDGRVLAVRPADEAGFRLPGGRILPGETALDAVLRELHALATIPLHERDVRFFAFYSPERADAGPRLVELYEAPRPVETARAARGAELRWIDLRHPDPDLDRTLAELLPALRVRDDDPDSGTVPARRRRTTTFRLGLRSVRA